MFNFSKVGVENENLYSSRYSDFIKWCKSVFIRGTFSTFEDGEPVFFGEGAELSYSDFKNLIEA